MDEPGADEEPDPGTRRGFGGPRRAVEQLEQPIGILGLDAWPVVQPPGPTAKAERMLMATDVGTPIEGGSLEVVVAVTVTYRAR